VVFFRPNKKDVDPRERAAWGDLLSLGLVLPIAIVLGFYIGRWVGGLFGHPAPGQYIGLVWGVATGFWELYKVNARITRMEEKAQAEKDHDSKPDA
jgi:Putative F0F1-ATPase subunit Ca2+/Mg2+ transporter